MSQLSVIPRTIKNRDAQKNPLCFVPQIQFIPDYETTSAVEHQHDHEIKVRVNNSLTESVSVFRGGNAGAYLSFLQVCKHINLAEF